MPVVGTEAPTIPEVFVGNRQTNAASRPITAAEIVAARPISEIWVALGGETPKRGRAKAFYRSGNNTQAVSLSDEKGCWYDHRDNIGGGVLDLVQHVLGGDRRSALRWLADLNGMPLHDRPLTLAERRQYARARQEAQELIAWKEQLVEALKKARRRWWGIYRGARQYLREHGLEAELGCVMATLYEVAEDTIEELEIDIDTLSAAGYPDLLLIFREQRARRAA